MAEILIIEVFENKRPLQWNFTSGLYLDSAIVIGMSLCIEKCRRQDHEFRSKLCSKPLLPLETFPDLYVIRNYITLH